MTILRSVDETWDAGAADGAGDPPLSQALADRVAAILAPCRLRAPEPQAA